MRIVMLLGVLTCATVAVAAQDASPATKAKKAAKGTPSIITAVGCVARGKAPGDRFTLKDEQGTATYQLSGLNMRRYLGRRVTVVGTEGPGRFRIVGGLTPSPNAAAQAGAQDQSKAAIAGDPFLTSPTGAPPLLELRVKGVRSVSSGCEKS